MRLAWISPQHINSQFGYCKLNLDFKIHFSKKKKDFKIHFGVWEFILSLSLSQAQCSFFFFFEV